MSQFAQLAFPILYYGRNAFSDGLYEALVVRFLSGLRASTLQLQCCHPYVG